MKETIDRIMIKKRHNDNAFQEKWSLIRSVLGHKRYSPNEIREIYFQGMKVGIETGLMNASIEGQIIELNEGVINPRHKEYFLKVCALSEEYNCAIQYSHKNGMVIVELNY